MSYSATKSAGSAALGLIFFGAICIIPIVLLFGAAEFSVWALEWIPGTISLAFLTCLLVIPFAFFPSTRGFAANLYDLASLVFGLSLWLFSLAVTYIEWGMFGAAVGILFFGIGVVFSGILASLFAGEWGVLGNIALIFILFMGTRVLGNCLSELSFRHKFNETLKNQRPSAVVIDISNN